MKRRPETQPG